MTLPLLIIIRNCQIPRPPTRDPFSCQRRSHRPAQRVIDHRSPVLVDRRTAVRLIEQQIFQNLIAVNPSSAGFRPESTSPSHQTMMTLRRDALAILDDAMQSGLLLRNIRRNPALGKQFLLFPLAVAACKLGCRDFWSKCTNCCSVARVRLCAINLLCQVCDLGCSVGAVLKITLNTRRSYLICICSL